MNIFLFFWCLSQVWRGSAGCFVGFIFVVGMGGRVIVLIFIIFIKSFYVLNNVHNYCSNLMFIHFEQMLRFTMFFKCCYILNMLNVHYEIINKSPRFEIQVAEQSVQNLCKIYATSIQHQCKIDSRGERADPAGVGVRFLHRGQVPPSELCPGVLRTLVVLLRSLCRTSENFGLGF